MKGRWQGGPGGLWGEPLRVVKSRMRKTAACEETREKRKGTGQIKTSRSIMLSHHPPSAPHPPADRSDTYRPLPSFSSRQAPSRPRLPFPSSSISQPSLVSGAPKDWRDGWLLTLWLSDVLLRLVGGGLDPDMELERKCFPRTVVPHTGAKTLSFCVLAVLWTPRLPSASIQTPSSIARAPRGGGFTIFDAPSTHL